MKVWTLIINGGEPVTLTLQDRLGPPLRHEGGRTIWKMVGTKEQAFSVVKMLMGPLVGAQVAFTTEEQTEEQAAMRLTGEEG